MCRECWSSDAVGNGPLAREEKTAVLGRGDSVRVTDVMGCCADAVGARRQRQQHERVGLCGCDDRVAVPIQHLRGVTGGVARMEGGLRPRTREWQSS